MPMAASSSASPAKAPIAAPGVSAGESTRRTPSPCCEAAQRNRGVHFANHSLIVPEIAAGGRVVRITTSYSGERHGAGQGIRKVQFLRALHPLLPDVLGYSDHRNAGIIAGAKRTTRSRKRWPIGFSAPPDPFCQSLMTMATLPSDALSVRSKPRPATTGAHRPK